MSFPRLHTDAKCEECPLYGEGTFVPSDGPEKADIVLVGEAPGRNEARYGKPFVGASGQLLGQVLSHYGLEREDLFITNVCLCRPKDNSTPTASAIRSCGDRLDKELRAREPQVIMALGNVASKTILQSDQGITKLRVGPPKETDAFPGVRVIPTFHPAASLYNPGSFPDIVTDFGKIKQALGEVHAVTIDWEPPVFTSFDDKAEAVSALRELGNSRYSDVAVDIEVGVEKDADFEHADQRRLLCVGFSYRPGAAIVVGEDPANTESVRDLLGEVLSTRGIIAQNGKFDLAGLYDLAPKAKLVFDTMLAHYCLDERRGTHSLEQLAIEYLGSPNWKAEIDKYVGTGKKKNYALIPRPVLYRYNAYDVSNTFLLRDTFTKLLMLEPELMELHNFLVKVSPAFMRMEMNGVGVDLDLNAQLFDEYQEELDQLRGLLREMAGDPSYNPNSWQQVKRALKDVFGVRVKNTRKETIASVLDKAAQKGNRTLYEFTTNHLAFKKEAKSYGTYVKGIRERVYRGRIHPTYLLHGTVTGRTSARNPNIQNVTRGSTLRRQFIPTDPGNVFVQVDYGQAELRVLCWLARDPYLRDVLSDPTRDIHGEVAARFFGPNWTKEQRVRAKAVVFGLGYGREAYSLAMEYDWPLKEAERYISEFFEVIPEVVRWREDVKDKVLSGEDLINPFGRHRRFWLITNQNMKDTIKEAYATLPQSTSSDFGLESLYRLQQAGLGDASRIFVHDSIALEVPPSEAVEVAHEVSRIMVEVAEEYTEGWPTFTAEAEIGPNWGELVPLEEWNAS